MSRYWTKTPEIEALRRKRISETMKGRKPSNLESLHALPRTKEWRENIRKGRTGIYHTDATKRRISDSKRKLTTPLCKAIRECYRYTNWRIAIFIRDGRACVLCGSQSTLNADHFPRRFVDLIKECDIQTMEDALDSKELWDIKNGRTLCFECHCKTDTFGNRNVRKQVT